MSYTFYQDCRGLRPADERRCLRRNSNVTEWTIFAFVMAVLATAFLVLIGVAL